MRPTMIISAAALLFSTGCPPKPDIRQADPRPLPDAHVVMEMLEAQAAARKTLRAQGRITYFGEKGRVRLKIVQVVERPARFRFETISPMEQPIDVMTSDGERLWLLSKGKLHEGPATPENISRLLPLPLRGDEVVSIMLGGVPASSRFEPKSVEWSDDPEDHWIVRLEGPGGERGELLIDPEKRRVMRAALLRADGVTRLRLSYDDFENLPVGGAFPREIKLEIPPQSLEVEIKLKEVEVNVEVSPTLFVLEPPAGVVPEPLPSPPASVANP